ncbi:hypothetical protein NN3_55170 [Nocardia neocaledoniensis NBRC 108232]|nr:hypothetical protein NN3_55170 [Nocardia neocaledoniensis NBRC 108232]
MLGAAVPASFASFGPLTPSVEVTNIPAFALVLCVRHQLFQVTARRAATGQEWTRIRRITRPRLPVTLRMSNADRTVRRGVRSLRRKPLSNLWAT